MKKSNSIFTLLLLVAGGIALLVLAANHASAATLTVDDSGGADYTHIQDAIDNASAEDTIRVYAGTYYENVVVNKTVNLIGNGSANTTINGGGSGDVVTITANWCNISGFTITGSGNDWGAGRSAGIKIKSSHNHISGNNLSKNKNGIYISFSLTDYNTISNNTIYNNSNGIYLNSKYNTLSNNNISNNQNGISFSLSSHNTLSQNIISNNTQYGIQISRSRYNTLSENSMEKNSIYIESEHFEDWNTHNIDTTNTVNGKPIYYYKSISNITVPSGAGEVILVNCTHIRVENQNLSNGTVGILIAYSSNITLLNNTCISNTQSGVWLYNSNSNVLSNNICILNNYCGIGLFESNFNTFSNNTILNNHDGIELITSNSNTLSNNTILNDYNGISLLQSSNNTVLSSTILGNKGDGITCLDHSNYNTISTNEISENRIGIYLSYKSKNNSVSFNKIYNNTDYGINATNNVGYSVDARNNWWGNASGPYHPTRNPRGTGDNVTDNVEFTPFLKNPVISNRNKEGPEEGSEKEPEYAPLIIFIVLLGALFALLTVVVKAPDKSRKKKD